MDGYTATAVVHTEEGAVLARGEQTNENFDPDSDFNAELIESGLLRPSGDAQAAPEPASGGSGTEAQNEAQIASHAVEATDKAAELAVSEGVDLADVEGTGDGGKITVDDVRAHLA